MEGWATSKAGIPSQATSTKTATGSRFQLFWGRVDPQNPATPVRFQLHVDHLRAVGARHRIDHAMERVAVDALQR